MTYQKIKTTPDLFTVTTPTVTKSKDFGNGKMSYIIKGTIAHLADSQLVDLCGDFAHVVKIYRNTPTFAVVIVQTHKPKGVFYRNRFGGFDAYIPGIGKMYIK